MAKEDKAADQATSQAGPQRFRRWRPKASPSCRPWPGCGWPPARPGSATRTAPMCCWPCWRPEPRWRASSPRPRPPPPRSNGAATQLKGGHGPRAGGQQRQRQCLHRQGRAGRACATIAEAAAAVVGCQAAGSFHGLDRGDRRAAAGRKNHRRFCRNWWQRGRRRRLARRRRSDHDHRHLSQAGHRHAPRSTASR